MDESSKKLRLKKRFLRVKSQALKANNINTNRWSKLFLFCLGLFTAGAFAMKWVEPDLIYNNEKISIFGLELFYPKEKIVEIFSGVSEKVKTILRYHLSFDFIFMAGCYPGMASLCMLAINKLKKPTLKKVLFILACLQLFAWSFDIIENLYLFKWLDDPRIDSEFLFYHFIVYSKWILALTATLVSVAIFVSSMFKRKNGNL